MQPVSTDAQQAYLKKLADFNPNQQREPWATFVPRRRPEFKVHKQRGLALNAISFGRRYGGILYTWDSGISQWREVWRHDCLVTPEKCDVCNAPGLHPSGWYNVLCWKWIAKKTEKPEYRCLCPNCARGLKNS